MVLFVTGIDTGVGKTYATGCLALSLLRAGRRVITAKLVQTGSQGPSEDLELHRRIMGIPWSDEDRQGLTCPYVFAFPGSPHLAARLEGRIIDPDRIRECVALLESRFDVVLVEGAGGVLVPLTPELLVLDFVAREGWPVVLVTGPRLGSLNHTLLTLEALKRRSLALAALVYNRAMEAPPEILEDTRQILETQVPGLPVIDLPVLDPIAPRDLDITALLRSLDP